MRGKSGLRGGFCHAGRAEAGTGAAENGLCGPRSWWDRRCVPQFVASGTRFAKLLTGSRSLGPTPVGRRGEAGDRRHWPRVTSCRAWASSSSSSGRSTTRAVADQPMADAIRQTDAALEIKVAEIAEQPEFFLSLLQYSTSPMEIKSSCYLLVFFGPLFRWPNCPAARRVDRRLLAAKSVTTGSSVYLLSAISQPGREFWSSSSFSHTVARRHIGLPCGRRRGALSRSSRRYVRRAPPSCPPKNFRFRRPVVTFRVFSPMRVSGKFEIEVTNSYGSQVVSLCRPAARHRSRGASRIQRQCG